MLTRYLFITSFLFIVSVTTVSAQLDSLLNIVQTLPAGEEKFLTYCEIAKNYNARDPHQVIAYCDTMDQLVMDGFALDKQSRSLYLRAIALEDIQQFDEALAVGLKALSLAETYKDSTKLAGYYNALGNIYSNKYLYDLSTAYYLKGATHAESMGQTAYAAHIYHNLATIFEDANDLQTAKKYYLLAKEQSELVGDYSTHGFLYIGLARPTTQLDTAINYLEKSIFYSHEQETQWVLSAAHLLLGERLAMKGQIDDAIKNYHQGLNYAITYQDTYYILSAYDFLGKLHLEQQQLDSANFYFQKCLAGVRQEDQRSLRKEVYLHLAQLEEARSGRSFEEAYWQKAYNLQDSIHQDNIKQKLQTSVAQFEFEKQEREIAEQKLQLAQAQNTRNRLLFGGVTLLLATAGVFQFFFFRQRRRKQQVELALAAEAREAERLRTLDELKTNFFTNVSHELRTPLTLITSPLEDALGKVKQINLQDDLALAHQNSKRLLGLINEILDLSKLEAGELRTEVTTVPLRDFLRRVFFSFQSAADLQSVKLDWQVPNDLDTSVRTDVAQLEKILNNLLSNAIKFTPSGGVISLVVDVSALTEQSRLRLSVKDTGKGIPAEDLPRIFDRFYQSAQPQPQGGTGIGLSLSRQLARLLGGDLIAQSSPGKGSTFELAIPVGVVAEHTVQTQEEDAATASEETQEVLPTLTFRSGRPQVLIVEDHPEMSQYLLQKLRVDYDCHLAENGEAALRLLAQQPFDLITSDVMMPAMDGFELRERINQNAEWRKIPFLLLTARTLEEDKIRGFQLGIDDYVTKPFSLPELRARIHNLLQNKQEREAVAADPATEVTTEEQLLQDAEALVRARLDDPSLTVEELAKALGYSQRNLSRIFGQLTGLTPVKFILEIRLQHARHLLERRQFSTVAEVRYEVGIESRSYFTNKFKQRFGKSPKTYLDTQ